LAKITAITRSSGLLATEAFDLAGDPVAFPEQVAGPTNAWSLIWRFAAVAAKKIYYFPDATGRIFSKGKARTTP